MKNESVKKSLQKSKKVPEEKRKMVQQKICMKKTNTFTISAMNFVQEQLKTIPLFNLIWTTITRILATKALKMFKMIQMLISPNAYYAPKLDKCPEYSFPFKPRVRSAYSFPAIN